MSLNLRDGDDIYVDKSLTPYYFIKLWLTICTQTGFNKIIITMVHLLTILFTNEISTLIFIYILTKLSS